jgi:hypothetical protein
MFAIGLARHLKDMGQDSDFFVMVGTDDITTEEELEYGDYDLEHVLLHTLRNGKHVFYDATGCITAPKIGKYCLDFHNRNYGGKIGECWLDLNSKTETIFRQNTDYSISSDVFYRFFKELTTKTGR